MTAPRRSSAVDSASSWSVATAPSDAALLQAWRTGDARAGEALVRRHYHAVRRFFDTKVPAAAEDMTQHAFLATMEGRDRVDGSDDSTFRAYVFGVARRLLLRHVRDKERFARMVRFHTAQAPTTAVTPTGVVALRREHRLLLRALDLLPLDQQIVLQLHYWEHMTTTEIGVVLEVPASTVTTRLSRARQRLRDEITGMRARAEVREALLADLDAWARSVAVSPTQRDA